MAGVVINSAKGIEVKKVSNNLEVGVDASFLGSVAIGTSTSGSSGQLLLQISGAAGAGAQCGIHLYSTGTISGTLLGSGGVADVAPDGSLVIYTDGSNLFFRKDDGSVMIVTATAL
tara:strand:- start:395 stop:742 length:348 start_codon:yes stop_codon:yes gene_type:complete